MYAVLEKIKELKIVPVVVLDDAQDATAVAKALIDGGLPVAEVTFRTDAAEESIKRIAKEFPDMLVGAGTVLTTDQVDRAVNAGAKFIVSPGFNPTVVKYCIDKNIPITPGCSTPSDMEKALEMGLKTVKFFPAETAGGIKAIKAMSAPYTSLTFMPTGGINAKNIKDYLSFNKIIACGGSWMVSKDLVKNKEFDKIRELTKEAVDLVNDKNKDDNTVKETCAKKSFVIPDMKDKKVVTLGEIMLRLSTPNNEKFIQADEFDINYGGGEANVAVSLANYGYKAEFVTAVPDNPIGKCAVAALRKYNVNCDDVYYGGERLGIYYLESGSAMRASNVIYDRAHSSISTARPENFDFDKIFKDAGWFHFTGITPAISDEAAILAKEACKAAKKAGVIVSCDLNFRKKLWTSEKAQKVMTDLMQYVDVCIGNEEDAEKVLGFKAQKTDVTKGELDLEGYKDVFCQMSERFGFKYIISSLRQSYSASNNGWSACIMDGQSKEFYHSKTYTILPIVDRVGGGDSFAAGCITGLLDKKDMKDALEFAVAASALKHTIPGDFNLVTRAEVDALVGGDGSGRVQR